MDIDNINIDNIGSIVLSLLFGIIVSLLFFYTFKPRYVIIKNKATQV